MKNMRFKVGDRVRIKSLYWYEKNKDEYGYVDCGKCLMNFENSQLCGKIVTISRINDVTGTYKIEEDNGLFFWTDEMIEGLMEKENLIERVDDNGLPFNEWLSHKGSFHVPDGYELKDENGNIINAQKIVLEKKKKEYPKTYEECCEVLGIPNSSMVVYYCRSEVDYEVALSRKLFALQKLLISRDAYWKIAGDEIGLGKPWSPSDNNKKPIHAITRYDGYIIKDESGGNDEILEFPTEEMRDAFKENFDPDIEICKELL